MANAEEVVALELRDAWRRCAKPLVKKVEGTGINAMLALCAEKLPSLTGSIMF